jgi:transposase
MEACSSAHWFAREVAALGHTARIIAPEFVRPFRLSGKNDANEAAAICAAERQPQLGFVGKFRCGRQFAAWLGLTPRQYSTGGKARLGRITRRGDTYLRGLLVQGARSALQAALRAAPPRRTKPAAWIVATYERVGYHKTLVAITNKRARLIRVLLDRDEPLRVQAAVN